MDSFDALLYGLSVAATPENLLAALIGALLGTAIGVLPGLGPIAGTALILPLTFAFPPVTGLIAMAGIYYGSMYGGSTTSILVNIPGEVASVITCIEGYQMTKRGRAGAALTVVAAGSFVAGTLAVVGVMLFSPVLSNLALSFGSPEYCALLVTALVVLFGISGGSLIRAAFGATLGLMIATVGVEAVTGIWRFDFGNLQLARGIQLVPVAVGLFGISEVFFLVEKLATTPKAPVVKLRELFPTREEWSRVIPAWLRGTVIGFPIGLFPGPVAVISTFASYQVEQSVSKRKDEFGKGAIEGVAGPEAANNAASTAAFVPLLSLGIPFSPVLALLVAAMLVQGIKPGPLLMEQYPEIFWGVIASMYIGNVMLLILNLPLVGLWVSLLRIPMHILIVGIVLFAMIGAYSVDNNSFDMWVLLFFGVVGYFLRKLDFDLAPLILALVLGPLIESRMRESLFMSRGDLAIFVSSPIAVAIWLLGLVMIAARFLLKAAGRVARANGSPTHGTSPGGNSARELQP